MPMSGSSWQDVPMGYSVCLIKGDVIIRASRADAALSAVRDLDSRDDLKTGGSRDSHGVRHPHWAFTNADEVRAAHTLMDALIAFRFEPMLS